MTRHLAELILDMKFHEKPDAMRKRLAFSEDIERAQVVLFNRNLPRKRRETALLRWIREEQPCVFGRVAAKNAKVFICILDQEDVVGMKRGDDDLREVLQLYRKAWKRYALDGRDPNGYTNILWCFGLHDRPWPERPVFGKIRSMVRSGMERKTDTDSYIREIKELNS